MHFEPLKERNVTINRGTTLSSTFVQRSATTKWFIVRTPLWHVKSLHQSMAGPEHPS